MPSTCFGGDPDGLFELVQHLLSPSVEIRGIIGSHLKAGDGFDPSKETAANAKKKIEEVLGSMMPYSDLLLKVRTQGKIGRYLADNIEGVMKMSIKYNFNVGETYIIGDSPLVLLTALQSSFEADPSSSYYALRQSPIINDQGLYEVNQKGET